MVTNCHQLKMKAADGKRYNTDVADAEQLLRVIQSIPSPKAEPFKLWLARVGYERMREIEDPELAGARRNLEDQTGKPVSTKQNYKNQIESDNRKSLPEGKK